MYLEIQVTRNGVRPVTGPKFFEGARFGNNCYSSIKKRRCQRSLSIFGPRNWLKMYPFFERAAVDEKQIQNEK